MYCWSMKPLCHDGDATACSDQMELAMYAPREVLIIHTTCALDMFSAVVRGVFSHIDGNG